MLLMHMILVGVPPPPLPLRINIEPVNKIVTKLISGRYLKTSVNFLISLKSVHRTWSSDSSTESMSPLKLHASYYHRFCTYNQSRVSHNKTNHLTVALHVAVTSIMPASSHVQSFQFHDIHMHRQYTATISVQFMSMGVGCLVSSIYFRTSKSKMIIVYCVLCTDV